MKVTGINGSASRSAELSRLWTNYDKLWERNEPNCELPTNSAAFAPLAQPQLALHNPQKGAAWFLRGSGAGRPLSGVWPRRRSPGGRTAVGGGGAIQSATGATESATGMIENVTGVPGSAASAIDIIIRAQNERAAFFSMLQRQETLPRHMGKNTPHVEKSRR